jgi:hypothetical protein
MQKYVDSYFHVVQSFIMLLKELSTHKLYCTLTVNGSQHQMMPTIWNKSVFQTNMFYSKIDITMKL